MDFLSWKCILLQWVNLLNLLGEKFHSISEAEIELFFNIFKKRVTKIDSSINLNTFFEEHYPTFSMVYNDDKKLCVDEYVFGYSLLLHFSFVKCPEPSFLSICNQFQKETQEAIVEFGSKLYRKELNRKIMESVILQLGTAKVANSIESPGGLVPIKPRAKTLNSCNSENQKLKALLKTKDDSMRELVIDNEALAQQVMILGAEKRKLVSKINQLENQLCDAQILAMDIKPTPPEDHRAKQIEEMEKIIQLNERIDELMTDNSNLQKEIVSIKFENNKSVERNNMRKDELKEMLKVATEEIVSRQQCVKELEGMIDEYKRQVSELCSGNNDFVGFPLPNPWVFLLSPPNYSNTHEI